MVFGLLAIYTLVFLIITFNVSIFQIISMVLNKTIDSFWFTDLSSYFGKTFLRWSRNATINC